MASNSGSEQPSDSQVTIDRIEMGTGWVCFQAGEMEPDPDQLPGYLNHAFYSWLQRNPEFKVRTALPVVASGNTVAIHVWFD